eukprot:scaffold221797_cov35-Tisochrysis_lutea.AAC.3
MPGFPLAIICPEFLRGNGGVVLPSSRELAHKEWHSAGTRYADLIDIANKDRSPPTNSCSTSLGALLSLILSHISLSPVAIYNV